VSLNFDIRNLHASFGLCVSSFLSNRRDKRTDRQGAVDNGAALGMAHGNGFSRHYIYCPGRWTSTAIACQAHNCTGGAQPCVMLRDAIVDVIRTCQHVTSLKVVVFAPRVVGECLGYPRHEDTRVDEVNDLYSTAVDNVHIDDVISLNNKKTQIYHKV